MPRKQRYQTEFDSSLTHNIVRLGHLLRQETLQSIVSLGVTPEQWQALVYLSNYDQGEGLTQNELAELILRDKTTVSRLVEHLLRQDLIVRSAGVEDRRTYRLQLSERGREVVEAAWPLVTEHFSTRVFTTLSQDEKDQLLGLLHKVRHELNDF